MPHALTPAMASLSIKGTTRLVRCWKIVLQLGRGTFFFTEHDRILVVDGDLYRPSNSVAASAATNEGDLGVPNTNVRGIISNERLTEKMLREGAFNGADVDEFLVDWRFPFAGTTRLTKYRIGRVSWNDAKKMFEADLVGQSERLTNRVGEIYTRTCRWNLGDTDCGIDVTTGTFAPRTATVTSIVDEASFITGVISGATLTDDFFQDGKITWTNSNNIDITSVVKRFTASTRLFELSSPPPTPIAVNDTISVTTGCNKLSGVDIDGKTVPTGHCKNKFNNLVNFGGYPFMPTNDKLYMTPFSKRNQ